MMTIDVVPDTCTGHASCIAAADDLFDIDDHGTVVVLRREVGAAEAARATAAVAACPVRALRLVEVPS